MEPYHEERYDRDLTQYQQQDHQLMDEFKKGPEAFKGAVSMLDSEALAGIYHFLHNEGGLGKLDTGFMDQIRSGALGLRNPEYIRAAIAIRVLMDEKPGAHAARQGMVRSPHEPVDPAKYKGGSPIIDKYMSGEPHPSKPPGMSEGQNKFEMRIKNIIKEEIQVILDQEV